MKLCTRLKTTVKRLNLKRFKRKKRKQNQVKAPKPVKKNTWPRRVKAWDLKLNHRLSQRDTSVAVTDETSRKCINCGQRYTGRICPQCGQAGSWSRYTWKQAFLNLLDIWGLGNRPMFRTLRELFCRPGYMIADYLNGHRQFYFPPFKLVAVAVVLLVCVNWITGDNGQSVLGAILEESGLKDVNDWTDITAFVENKLGRFHLSDTLFSAFSAIIWFLWFLSKNMLYECLFIGAVLVVCIWIAFKKVNCYNFVETYIFLTYVLAQFLFCMIPGSILSCAQRGIEAAISSGMGALPTSLLSILDTGVDYFGKLYAVAVAFLLVLDFRQFFGQTWRSTLWHLFLVLMVALALVVCVASIGQGVIDKNFQIIINLLYAIVAIALYIKCFGYADEFLNKHKGLVSQTAINCSKVGMLSVLILPKALDINRVQNVFLEIVGDMFLAGLYLVLAVTLSLLPVIVYKKFHRSWLACLSLFPVILLVLAVSRA